MRKNDNINYDRPYLRGSYSVRHGYRPDATLPLPRKRTPGSARKAFLTRLADSILVRGTMRGPGCRRLSTATKIINADWRKPAD